MKVKHFSLLTLFGVFGFWGCAQTPKINDNIKESEFSVLTQRDVVCGAGRWNEYKALVEDKSVGLVVNQTSMVGDQHLVDFLIEKGVNVDRIFAPEHGFRGEADAGEEVGSGMDERTGITIKSLYGQNKKPSTEDLKGLDIVIFDIQDVGARFYTYLSTMKYVIDACGRDGIEVIILDRPNPHGFYVDGPVLDTNFRSFVGILPIPIIHGMTLGELSLMLVGEGWCDYNAPQIKVVTCENYDHNSTFVLPIKPSPNLPNHTSVMLYPSLCFFEPSAFSIGRGTEKQFQVLGRPDYGGGTFQFTPVSQLGAKNPKHENKLCKGYDFSEFDLNTIYQQGRLNLNFIIQHLSGENIHLIDNVDFFNLLVGTDVLYQQLKNAKSETDIRTSWKSDLDKFKLKRKKYLLYPEAH